MTKFICFFFIFLASVFPQDQREIIDLLAGEQGEKQKTLFNFAMRPYLLDLNGDNDLERVEISKRDGIDWLAIYHAGDKIFETSFKAYGGNAYIYKLRRKKLSANESLLAIYYYDGQEKLIDFNGTARLYLLSFTDDLKKFWIKKGPYVWHEQELEFYGHYHRRGYGVSFADMNKDGKTDVTVHYRKTSRLMLYHGNGEWLNL